MVAMQGFSEKGAPRDWDMAVGSVRGFRWWRVSILLRKHTPSGALRYYPTLVNPFDSVWNPKEPYMPMYAEMAYETIQPWQSWVPEMNSAHVMGFFDRTWAKHKATDPDKRYRAECHKTDPNWDNGFKPHSNSVPDPNCGCGFWAYWNTLDENAWWLSITPHVTRQGKEMTLVVPIAGMIEGSGRVIIGERGFRCEYARITDLAIKVQGPCAYTNVDEQLQREFLYDRTSNGSVYTFSSDTISVYPQQRGEFLPLAAQESGLSMDKIYEVIVAGVVKNLGDEYKSWASVENLIHGAKRDENYA